jgi:hypothetical protein
MKEVKHFNEHRANVRVDELQKEAKKLGELIKLLRTITNDKEIKTLGAFNDWLCEQSGFKSPSFSADSMDLGDAYRQVKYLSDLTPNVAIEDLTPMYALKAKKIEQIKEEFTTYYTKAEKEVRAKFNKIVAEWETLPHEIKVNSFINRTGNLLSGHIAVK